MQVNWPRLIRKMLRRLFKLKPKEANRVRQAVLRTKKDDHGT